MIQSISNYKKRRLLQANMVPIIEWPNATVETVSRDEISKTNGVKLQKQLDKVFNICKINIDALKEKTVHQAYLELISSFGTNSQSYLLSCNQISAALILDGYISQEEEISYPYFRRVFKTSTDSYMFLVKSLPDIIIKIHTHEKIQKNKLLDSLIALYNCLYYHNRTFQNGHYVQYTSKVCYVLYLLYWEVLIS